ncbi:MAG TPA: stalk domain-containing protein [Symbiobacteriaceae bacterium]|jgi:hypothetical protein|nr:stalk domain-containing protein [Symbiobacteriaceae bacterium]
MKRLLSLLLLCLTLSAGLPGAAVYADDRTPRVLLDGLPLTFDVDPMIVQGRTLVPFRAIAEALGVDVVWTESTRSIQAYGPDTVVFLRIGDPIMYVNGTAVELDVPPMIVNSRTLLPLRAFSSAFGAEIGWDGETYTVFVTSRVRQMRMLGFYIRPSFPRRHLVPAFSDVAYGWARFTEDGSVVTDGDFFRWPLPDGEITGEVLLEEAAAAGTKRYLMVFAEDADAPVATNLVLDEARIARAADGVAALVAEKGFDGALLDVETLGLGKEGEELEQVRQGFVHLVSAVADRLRAVGKETIVSVPPPPPNGWYLGYDHAALAEAADALQLMAHDYGGDEPEPPALVEEGIRLAVAAVGEANRHKLLLGVRFLETPDSLRQLVGLAKRHRLGGISFWFIGELTDEQKAALDSTVTRTE